MQKSILFLTCIILLAACRKETVPAKVAENSGQLLTALIKTTTFSNSLLYNEKIVFEYDAAKKMTREGGKHYYRDAQERITRVTLPIDIFYPAIREIQVHYTNETSKAVDYTICHFKVQGIPGHDSATVYDSSVYLHHNGKLTNIVEYFSYSDNGIDYTPGRNYNFTYDENGNIKTVYANACFYYNNDEYDSRVNPLYTDDEVRMLETFFDTGNISTHNLVKSNHLDNNKVYEYRADGRPRFCTIRDNAGNTIRLTYQYQ